MMTAHNFPLDDAVPHLPTEADLDDLLNRAFNACGSTLNKQPLSRLLKKNEGDTMDIYNKLTDDSQILAILKRELSPQNLTILRLAYQHTLRVSDVCLVYTDLTPPISDHFAQTHHVHLPPRFTLIAILDALRQQPLFKQAIVDLDPDNDLPETERRYYYRCYRSLTTATRTWITQAKKTAQIALRGFVSV